jgi:hypothetical protein
MTNINILIFFAFYSPSSFYFSSLLYFSFLCSFSLLLPFSIFFLHLIFFSFSDYSSKLSILFPFYYSYIYFRYDLAILKVSSAYLKSSYRPFQFVSRSNSTFVVVLLNHGPRTYLVTTYRSFYIIKEFEKFSKKSL